MNEFHITDFTKSMDFVEPMEAVVDMPLHYIILAEVYFSSNMFHNFTYNYIKLHRYNIIRRKYIIHKNGK